MGVSVVCFERLGANPQPCCPVSDPSRTEPNRHERLYEDRFWPEMELQSRLASTNTRKKAEFIINAYSLYIQAEARAVDIVQWSSEV